MKLYSGSKKLRSTCSRNIHPVRRTPSVSSPVDEEEIKIKMDDGVARYLTLFGGSFIFYLLTCGRSSLVSGTQNDIVIS